MPFGTAWFSQLGGLPMPNDSTTQLQRYLDLINRGDATARDALVRHSCERLRRLTRKMLKSYPRLRRWQQTDDVLQNAILRLDRSLAKVRPESVRQFFGLAATQIRRELIDLARHEFRSLGDAAHHHSDGDHNKENALLAKADPTAEPENLEEWTAFHEQVERLPDNEREVFSLLWYDGLSQKEAASQLGVDVRTVKRRWQSARVMVYEARRGRCPE